MCNFANAVLAPAFIDLHIHGGARFDCMDNDAQALPAIEHLLASHGVGSYFPTTVTAPLDKTLAAVERLADAIEQDGTRSNQRSRPLGIHLEGPFLSHARRGVHPPARSAAADACHVRPALAGRARQYQNSHHRAGTRRLCRVDCRSRRVAGCASVSDIRTLILTRRAAPSNSGRGMRRIRSTRCGRSDIADPGVLGEVLTDSRVTADIIADGIHLDPAIVKLFLKAKGGEHSVLITDATAATGMPDGRYRLGSIEVEVNKRGLHGGRPSCRQRSHHGSRRPQRDEVCRLAAAANRSDLPR